MTGRASERATTAPRRATRDGQRATVRSLRRQLTLSLTVTLVVLVLAGGGVFHVAVRARLQRDFDAAMLAKARALAVLVEQEGEGRVEFELTGGLMPEFEGGEAPEHFQIWLPDGSTLARSRSLGDASLRPPPLGEAGPEFWDLTLPDGRRGRAVALRFEPKREDADSAAPLLLTLVCARERASLDRTLATLLGAVIATGAALPLIAALAVWRLVRRGLRPLDRLAAEASRLRPEALDHRFDLAGLPAELQPIGAQLNAALERLEAAFARERRFTSDVAHELRTPLAELRAAVEVARRWPDDAALATRGLETAHGVALQMERLVTNLLALRRSQSGPAAPAAPEPVDLAALLATCWQPFAERARAKRLTATLDGLARVEIPTDRALLAAVLTNLADNAVEHTPEGGSVTWRVAATAEGAEIAVANTNDALTAADLPHLGEPFWRKDAARTGDAHSGLGLTLAHAYAARLGAALTHRLLTPGLFETRLAIPRAR